MKITDYIGQSQANALPLVRKIRKSEKIYRDQNVLEACLERLRILFTEFDTICFSVSGGKDSGTLLQLADGVAKKYNKKYYVLYIDLEAGYYETRRFLLALRKKVKPRCKAFYWVCLPLAEENATSALNPEFITWDPSAEDYWIMEIPEGAITEDHNPFPFYDGIGDFDRFCHDFSLWLHEKTHATRTAQVVGIRTDESLRRYMAVANDNKPRYKDYYWTTELVPNIYAVYPIYDWKTEDIWGAVAKFDLDYNHVYEDMYKAGIPISQQRICQPFGQAQKAGLDQFRYIEPETWEKLLQRVEGVNFGAIYCRTSLLGHMSSCKPDHMTWQQYAVFLLESIGLYEPKIMQRYYQKIKYYMLWIEKNEEIPYTKMPEEATGLNASWRRVARAIERNDFYLTYLQFGYDKAGDELLIELRDKHRLTGQGHIQRKLYRHIKKIQEEKPHSMKKRSQK